MSADDNRYFGKEDIKSWLAYLTFMVQLCLIAMVFLAVVMGLFRWAFFCWDVLS